MGINPKRLLPPNRCAFWDVAPEWGWPLCSHNLQLHHVLNKTWIAGNRRVLRLVEKKYPRYLLRWVCSVHNRERFADSKRARRFLLDQIPADLKDQIMAEINAEYKVNREAY